MAGVVPADYGGHDGYGFETFLLNGVRIVGHRGGFPGKFQIRWSFIQISGTCSSYSATGDANSTEIIAKCVRT